MRHITTGPQLVAAVREVLAKYQLVHKTEQISVTGSIVTGKERRVDVTVYESQINWLESSKLGKPILQIECRYQSVSGTAEEKFFLAVAERTRDIDLGLGSLVVFHGPGFSTATRRHSLLNGCIPFAAFEDWVMAFFGIPSRCQDCAEPLLRLENNGSDVVLCENEQCQTELSFDVNE